MIKVGIVGATGYTGVELLRLLAQHRDVQIVTVTSRGDAGTDVSAMFPSLRQRVDLKFEDPAKANLKSCDVVFFATPNGVAMQQAPELLNAGIKIIDLAADFRITDVAEWEKWYGMTHASPEWVSKAVYGLPEANRSAIRQACLVANPGCYPTAVQLGFMPLVANDLINLDCLIVDAKSGVSGAGRKAEVSTLFSEASDNFKAYAASGHRHLPEINQGLSRMAGRKVGVTFVPHLTPLVRGIHATLYAQIKKEADFQKLYEAHYANEAFIDIMPPGSHPDTRSVRAANFCRIAIHRPQNSDVLVILSVIDNLVKGAAGQAVQNMNVMFDLPETEGIWQLPVFP
jgi:N-acetyl-gamma-glutamyl-phosphate reductase